MMIHSRAIRASLAFLVPATFWDNIAQLEAADAFQQYGSPGGVGVRLLQWHVWCHGRYTPAKAMTITKPEVLSEVGWIFGIQVQTSPPPDSAAIVVVVAGPLTLEESNG